MTEKRLWSGLKDLEECEDIPNSVEFWRVENTAGVSMPDVHYQIEKFGTGWIENKWVNKIGNKIKFQEGQERWLATYCRNGGEAFVLVGDNKGWMALYWGEDFCTENLEKINQKLIDPIGVYKRDRTGYIEMFKSIIHWCA